LLLRLLSSIILIPIVSIPAYYGGFLYAGLLGIAAVLAANEYDQLLRHGGHYPLRAAGFTLILIFLCDAFWPASGLLRYGVPLFAMASLAWTLRATDLRSGLVNWALTVGGAFYIGSLLAAIWSLRQMSLGLELSALAAFVTWSNDTGAYVIGTRFGQHRLAPRISPKKSWEGALGGSVLGTLVGALWCSYALPDIPLYHALILSALSAVMGIVGDLVESFIKRQVGAKDASEFIPGHGGVLDRLDSLLFAFATTLLYAVWILQLK
jgi:phosphatidate cytidylyltransferase